MTDPRGQAAQVVVVDSDTELPNRSKKPVVILPYYGEFGHFVNSFIRQVHYLEAPDKVVCCQRGEELYFPSATGFYYNWTNPFSADEKEGYRNSWPPDAKFSFTADEMALISRLASEFVGYQITLLAEPLTDAQVVSMPLPITTRAAELRHFDVVACCRRRGWDAYRNFDSWYAVLAPLAAKGFSIAVVGEACSSYDFEFIHFRSWMHSPNPEAVMHTLSSSRLYIGTDTGPTHLAALVSRALLLFRNEACPYKNYIEDVVSLVAASRAVPFCYLRNGWKCPEEVSDAALRFLLHGGF